MSDEPSRDPYAAELASAPPASGSGFGAVLAAESTSQHSGLLREGAAGAPAATIETFAPRDSSSEPARPLFQDHPEVLDYVKSFHF